MEQIVALNRLIRDFENAKPNSLQESRLKSDFIEPFFKMLGWKFNSEDSKNFAHPEIKKLTKINNLYPDYLFTLCYKKQFYVKIFPLDKEQKNQSEFLTELHRICWTNNTSIGIITNFDSFQIYDFNKKPGLKIKSVFHCSSGDYQKHWTKISNLLSKESVNKGSLKKYQRESINTVYYYLANQILSWQKSLKDYLLKNFPDLSEHDVKITVSRLINRIMFLRICENLGLEPVNQLKNLLDKNQIYQTLLDVFEKANDKYNSSIFYFKKESGRREESLDLISFKINIDNSILQEIIYTLYTSENPVNFSILPYDILVASYYISLSFTNDNTDKSIITKEAIKDLSYQKNAKFAELTIDRSHTLALEGKKPGKRSSVQHLRILDPCCGSGLFLINSFNYLLNWHLQEYISMFFQNNTRKDELPIIKLDSGQWQLKWEEKRRILEQNIFGIDMNRIAVEATSFLLQMKLLQDISPKKIQDQLKLFWQHALPDLDKNIKCGNTLIESDIYKLQQFISIEENQNVIINAFDWQKAFKRFQPNENFDIIIGQLPIKFSEFFIQKVKPYFKQRYDYFKDFKTTYLLFFEKSLRLLKKNGVLGFILPSDWLSNRESFMILENQWIIDVYKINTRIKSKDIASNLLVIIKKQFAGETNVYEIKNFNFEKVFRKHHFKLINYLNINYFYGYFEKFAGSDLCKKIELYSEPFKKIATSYSGYNAYEKGKGLSPEGHPQNQDTLKLKPYHSDKKLNEQWKTEIIGKDITRFCLKFSGMRWVKYGPWLAAPRNPEIFNGTRILVHERISITDGRIAGSICSNEVFHGRDIIAIKPKSEFPNIYFLLALLNSKLFNWYYLVNFPSKSNNGLPKLLIANLDSCPVKNIQKNNSSENNMYLELISLTKRILELNQKKLEALSEREKTTFVKMINNIDEQIDDVIYKLYSLSKVEIEIIENSFNIKY